MSNRKLIVIVVILAVAGVALLMFRFFTRTARALGGAMANTIVAGDHVLMVKSFGDIERGQLVVCPYSDDPTYHIFRVIGLPGETIQTRGRTVYINGRPLAEQKVEVVEEAEGGPMRVTSKQGAGAYAVFYSMPVAQEEDALSYTKFGTFEPFRIPADSYFMMGDNRDNSEDSRYRGAVPRDLIWGTAVLIYYSEHSGRMFTRVH